MLIVTEVIVYGLYPSNWPIWGHLKVFSTGRFFSSACIGPPGGHMLEAIRPRHGPRCILPDAILIYVRTAFDRNKSPGGAVFWGSENYLKTDIFEFLCASLQGRMDQ